MEAHFEDSLQDKVVVFCFYSDGTVRALRWNIEIIWQSILKENMDRYVIHLQSYINFGYKIAD